MPIAVQPKFQNRVKSIVSGDVLFKIYPSSAGHSAAALSVATPSSVTQTLTIRLEDTQGRLLDLLTGFDIDVSISASNYQGSADPSDPTISDATAAVVNGIASVVLTYDTNTNPAQKVYTAGDTITVTVSDRASTMLVNYGVADVTWTDTIVA